MIMSKNRVRRNKLKLLFAAAAIVFMRRTLYLSALVSLPFSVLSPGNMLSAKSDEVRFNDVAGHWAEEQIL